MHRSTFKRTIGAAGLSSLTAAISVVAFGSAQASATPQQCGQVRIENSKDGGQTWSVNGRLDGAAPTKISVRLTGEVKQGCEYPVSLASYSAEGATWETSGKQEFLGWDTVKLNSEKTEASLDVSAFAPSCSGQIDMYGNSNKYDGTGGHALPQYPSVITPDDLITVWNGGAPCESAPSTPPASPSEPSTPSPSESETSSDSPSPSSTVPPASTEPPTGSPIAQPASTTPTENLAETGGNSSQLVAFSFAGAALLASGGGAVYFIRRRNRTPTSY
ncbi:LPXTG cell wall anchor domain-containing protein [Streptomyces sp. NPDC048473]|uniref:LPXTG cell wall anchor domain-containing protein n=1 Tax=unclassified Streptomyces TaxID=2593676 RepID=UPI00371AF6FC